MALAGSEEDRGPEDQDACKIIVSSVFSANVSSVTTLPHMRKARLFGHLSMRELSVTDAQMPL